MVGVEVGGVYICFAPRPTHTRTHTHTDTHTDTHTNTLKSTMQTSKIVYEIGHST